MIDQIALRLLLVIVFAVTTQVSEHDLIDKEAESNEEMFNVERKEEDKKNSPIVESENLVTVSSDQAKVESINEVEVEEEKNYHKIKEWLNQFPEIEGESQAAEFIQTISPLAVLIAEENGIYPSVMIAQAGLESAWGTSGLAQNYNNLMGTKGSWKGKSVTMATGEEVAGEKVRIKAGFSVYDSWADSLNRYGQLMRNGLDWDQYFYQGTWRENAADYTEATEWLVGRYATDSSYAEKLNATIQAYDLTEFDEIEALDLDYGEYVTETSLEI
ncbi:MAG TPA: glycoside hydrolase family 73 protein [Atopostipes sp.]|nr:glycoside hydrolase family 73 protein [Atopostipes sp.]